MRDGGWHYVYLLCGGVSCVGVGWGGATDPVGMWGGGCPMR